MHLAAWKGDLEIVRILVSQGPSRANVNQLNDQEDSALHLASQYGYSDIVEFLLQVHVGHTPWVESKSKWGGGGLLYPVSATKLCFEAKKINFNFHSVLCDLVYFLVCAL